jgi:hypothetical protein
MVIKVSNNLALNHEGNQLLHIHWKCFVIKQDVVDQLTVDSIFIPSTLQAVLTSSSVSLSKIKRVARSVARLTARLWARSGVTWLPLMASGGGNPGEGDEEGEDCSFPLASSWAAS